MTELHQFWAVAGLMVGRYGHDAHARAEACARQAEHDGDSDAHAIWSGVLGALHGQAGYAEGD